MSVLLGDDELQIYESLPETLDDHPFSYWRDTIDDLIEIREDN